LGGLLCIEPVRVVRIGPGESFDRARDAWSGPTRREQARLPDGS
jgi:hypothetical protein